jgi:hypothetical protein
MTPGLEISQFHVGDCYSNDQIFQSLGVSNAGGVRVALKESSTVRRMVVMTSASTLKQQVENPYHDRIEGDVLVYTGAGREGDQRLSGANLRLPQQETTPFPIYGFELIGSRRNKSIGPCRWRFLGLLEYIRHFQESQIDARGTSRLAWMFEFLIHRSPDSIPVDTDAEIAKSLRDRSRLDHSEVENAPRDEGPPASIEVPATKVSIAETDAIRSSLLSVTPLQFEHIVKDILIRSGFDRVVVTKYSQDGGIDVNAYPGSAMWPLGDLLIQAQAKRWLHTVGRSRGGRTKR